MNTRPRDLRLPLLILALATTTLAHAQPQPGLSREALAGPLAQTGAVLFIVHPDPEDTFHPTGRRGTVAPTPGGPGSGGGVTVCRLDLSSGQREVLWQLPAGDVQGACLTHDGQRVLLGLRLGGPEQPYHLAELNLAAVNVPAHPDPVRWLTEGPFDDIEPAALSDGRIVFASTRGRRWCNRVDAAAFALYVRDPDGWSVRPMSSHGSSPRHPTVLADGRVAFAAWDEAEGVTSPALQLFATDPDDATGQTRLSGNPRLPLTWMQPRPVPGTTRLAAVVTPAGALTREKGWVAILDPAPGPEAPDGVRLLGVHPDRHARLLGAAPDGAPGDRPMHVEHPEFRWRHPWPLDDDWLLVTSDREVCVMDRRGFWDILHAETELEGALGWAQPLPPQPREPRLASTGPRP